MTYSIQTILMSQALFLRRRFLHPVSHASGFAATGTKIRSSTGKMGKEKGLRCSLASNNNKKNRRRSWKSLATRTDNQYFEAACLQYSYRRMYALSYRTSRRGLIPVLHKSTLLCPPPPPAQLIGPCHPCARTTASKSSPSYDAATLYATRQTLRASLRDRCKQLPAWIMV